MKIRSKETWNDGTPVLWEVEVREIPLDEETLSEWYDRDAQENREAIAQGAQIRAFIVEAILVTPDRIRIQDENETIAGGEFSAVCVGDKLVVLMNHKEYAEKLYGEEFPTFSPWPTLINIQDCGFAVEVAG